MGEVVAWIIMALIEAVFVAIPFAIIDAVRLRRGRRRWRDESGPALRARLVAERQGALIFTAAQLDGTLSARPQWLVVVVDPHAIVGHLASGEEAWTVAWSDILKIKRAWSKHVVVDERSGAIKLLPITADRTAASKTQQDEIVRRMLVKRETAAAAVGGDSPAK